MVRVSTGAGRSSEHGTTIASDGCQSAARRLHSLPTPPRSGPRCWVEHPHRDDDSSPAASPRGAARVRSDSRRDPAPLHNHADGPGRRPAERGLTLRREAHSAVDGCSRLILPRSSLQSVERPTLAARGARADYFGTGTRSGTVQSPTRPFRSKLPCMLRAPLGRPQKTPYLEPSGLSSVPETEPSLPMVAVTCTGAPFTVSVPVRDVPRRAARARSAPGSRRC